MTKKNEEYNVLTEDECKLICQAVLHYGRAFAMGQSGGEEILPELDIILEKLEWDPDDPLSNFNE